MKKSSMKAAQDYNGIPVKIFWDLEGIFDLSNDNEIVDISNEIVAHSKKFGRITSFCGYGDMKSFLMPIQQIKLQTGGVTLIDTPKCHNKSYCDKKILIDICKFVNNFRFLPQKMSETEQEISLENLKGVIVLVTKSPAAYLFSLLRLTTLGFKIVIFCEKSKEIEQELILIDKKNIEFCDWKDINLFSFADRAEKQRIQLFNRILKLFGEIVHQFISKQQNFKENETLSFLILELFQFLQKESKNDPQIPNFLRFFRNYMLFYRTCDQFDIIARDCNEKGLNYKKVEMLRIKREENTPKERIMLSKLSALEKKAIHDLQEKIKEKDKDVEIVKGFRSVSVEEFENLPKYEEIDLMFLVLFIEENFVNSGKSKNFEIEFEKKRIQFSLEEDQDFSEKTKISLTLLIQKDANK